MQRKQTLCYQVPFNLHNNIFFSGEESVSAEMKSIFPSMQPTSSRNTDEQQSHEALMACAISCSHSYVAIHQVLHQRTPEGVESM